MQSAKVFCTKRSLRVQLTVMNDCQYVSSFFVIEFLIANIKVKDT